MARRASVLSTEAAREMLRGVQLRCTANRVVVLQYLADAAMPVSHADAAEALVPEGFDKSTIFRALVEMSDAGLVSRLDLGDHLWRFELRGKQQEGEHPHFLCLECGKVTCLDDVRVKILPSSSGKQVGAIQEVLLKGHCADCTIG